jgi:eukaryotic-like serine/threonine-protein kinase
VEELGPDDPRLVGSYRLLGRLGTGGMGRVFLGQSPGGRRVAVKVIRPDLADAPDFRQRFAREVAAARRVSGIFTAPVVDADPEAPEPWLVTAYVDGPSLAGYVAERGALPESEVASLGRALAEGLAAIHAAGIVHRDLKPANVLLATDGPRIIDFGISRAAESTALTQSGLVVGSPGFMSPEQALGREVGAASDVFSLGAVLAFAATGLDPFGAGSAATLLYRVVHADPDLTGIPDGLRAVVGACLRKMPAERPAPGALLTMLAPVRNSRPGPGDLGPIARPAGPVRAAYSATEQADLGSASRVGALAGAPRDSPRGVPGGAQPAMAVRERPDTVLTASPIRRRVRWPLIGLCTAIAVLAGSGAGLAWHDFGTRTPVSAGSSRTGQTAAVRPKPRAVVTEYFAAINDHNWRKVWDLGGVNLGSSYAHLVAGFHDTGHDVITHMTVDGDDVSVRILAYETTGTVQVYADRYTVAGGVITSGHQTLIAARPAPSS